DTGRIGNIYCNQVGVHVSIEHVPLYSKIHIARDINKSNILWLCRVGIINNMDSFIKFVEKNIIAVDIELTGILQLFCGIAFDIGPGLILGLINRNKVSVGMCAPAFIFYAS